jgi:hypothetical protein
LDVDFYKENSGVKVEKEADNDNYLVMNSANSTGIVTMSLRQRMMHRVSLYAKKVVPVNFRKESRIRKE